MAFFDISLRQNDNPDDDADDRVFDDNNFHFRIDENGDLQRDKTFHSFINVSLFTDRRADSSEVEQPLKRRGWQGDELLNLEDYFIGSKLWLFDQARNTIETKNKAVETVRNALKWFVRVGYCDRVEVTGRRIMPITLEITSTFFVEDNVIHSFTFDVWQKTNDEPARLIPDPIIETATNWQFIDESNVQFIDETNAQFTGETP